MRDSAYKHQSSGDVFNTIAVNVYMLPITPVTNKVGLLNNDTVRVLSKEQVEKLKGLKQKSEK